MAAGVSQPNSCTLRRRPQDREDHLRLQPHCYSSIRPSTSTMLIVWHLKHVTFRDRTPFSRMFARSIARAPQAFDNPRQRKIPASGANQHHHVEFLSEPALALVLHALSAVVQAPELNLPGHLHASPSVSTAMNPLPFTRIRDNKLIRSRSRAHASRRRRWRSFAEGVRRDPQVQAAVYDDVQRTIVRWMQSIIER